MNFLAHTYLSGTSDEILVGNFIGDYVKGRYFSNYPEEIRQGIIIHRNIDNYTDTHAIVKQTKSHFAERYGKYAGIVVDIIYDHYLAKFWNLYCDIQLDEFIINLHKRLSGFYPIFPPRVKEFFPKFIKNNWIKAYTSLDGLERVLFGMSRTTSLPNETSFAMQSLILNYDEIGEEFKAYFPQLVSFIIKSFDVKLVHDFGMDEVKAQAS